MRLSFSPRGMSQDNLPLSTTSNRDVCHLEPRLVRAPQLTKTMTHMVHPLQKRESDQSYISSCQRHHGNALAA